jgi:hypothetical protein
MGDDRQRIKVVLVHKQHHQLAVALVSPVVWAWARRLGMSGDLQVKCAQHR